MNSYSVPLIAAVLVGLLLTGCSAPSELKALDRPATADDRLPDGVQVSDVDNPENVRLLVVDDGVKYFAVTKKESHAACLIVVPTATPPMWGSSCSSPVSDGEIVKVDVRGAGSTMLVTDGYDTNQLQSEGWKKVHDNLLVARG
ncbi:hypothetical protein [Arthrobacter globiformis]|uniref:hypothetical protein n=1 Tax=Arthrobacter globiformis TaxID=1665 RepID=UPI0011B94AAE|nr:hypothetical protein [Arthrobacter globiformis]